LKDFIECKKYWMSVSTRTLKLISFFIAAVLFTQALFGQQKFVFEKPAMGSPFTISIFANDSAKAAQAAASAFH
jgi:hypothetical protein